MKQLAVVNPKNISEYEANTYPIRNAARAVIVDENNLIGLLHVAEGDYYKIPGGGIEESEDKYEALKRECLEEIGCDIEIINEIGYIEEYRKMFNLKQISYGYFAKVVGGKKEPHYTDDELREGFEPLWLSYEEAFTKLSQNKGTTLESKLYMAPRDTLFLKNAKKFLKGGEMI